MRPSSRTQPGRATILQGAIHLVIFGVFLLLAAVPWYDPIALTFEKGVSSRSPGRGVTGRLVLRSRR